MRAPSRGSRANTSRRWRAPPRRRSTRRARPAAAVVSGGRTRRLWGPSNGRRAPRARPGGRARGRPMEAAGELAQLGERRRELRADRVEELRRGWIVVDLSLEHADMHRDCQKPLLLDMKLPRGRRVPSALSHRLHVRANYPAPVGPRTYMFDTAGTSVGRRPAVSI